MANTELIEFLPDTCSPQSVPHTYGCIGTRGQDRIPNTYGFDLPTDFGTTNATDTYLHAVDDNVGGITYFYPPSVNNPTSPVVATNVAAIQSFLTSIGSGITYTINAFNEIVLTYAALGDENRWSFWMGTSNPDGYTNKLLPTLHDLRVDTVTYQEVQIIKQQNNDGTYADKFFLPSGNSALTEVALAADQTFKFGTCPDCKKEIFATHQRFYEVDNGGTPVCTPIQEVKEKDSCTGLETYRYVIEDGAGNLVDASSVIVGFDESNVLLKCPSIEYIPHQSGCIKRNTSALVQTCVTTTENFNFPSSEVYTQNKIADDGLGNYTIEVVGSTTLISTYSGMATTMLNPNSRMKENIGSGTLLFDFHNGNFSNTILINPNTFRFDLHFENGVTDIPTPLDSPCADPVPDSKYQSDAVFLINNVYNLMPLGVPQNSGGVNIDFVVTHYESKLLPSGNTFIYLPAKQFVYNDLEGTLIEEYRSIGEIQTLIEFNKVTDLFGNECEPEKLQILEKEVCGTIDGSADTYELIRVYTRNPTTGASTILFYEDKFGNQITGVVVEVCCTCDTLCTVAPALPLLSSVTAYARSLTGQCGDKFVIGAGIQWQVKIYQNGALILNSTTSPILTSQAAAFTWLDSNAGGYWLNTTTLPWAFANNINTYQFVSPTDPDEYLMILTETGNGASYCGGNLTSFRWAFTNRGISLGTSCDNADAFAWSDLWADRTGWDWKC